MGASSHISVKLESKELFKGVKSSYFQCTLLTGQKSDIDALIIEETVQKLEPFRHFNKFKKRITEKYQAQEKKRDQTTIWIGNHFKPCDHIEGPNSICGVDLKLD